MNKTEQVLVGIAKAEATANAGFVERSGARHVEGGHTLVCIPDIHHAIGVDVWRVDLAQAEKFIPVETKFFEGRISVGFDEVFGDNRFCAFFIDDLRIRRIEFFLLSVLLVAEKKNDLARLSWL